MARRSVMFTPGDQPDRMWKAPDSAADVVIFDLEDAIDPAEKDVARERVNEVLTDPDFEPAPELWVRCNHRPAAMVADVDTALAGDPRVDGVVLPMADSAADPERLADVLADAGHALPVLPQVETAAGVLHAEEVAAAAPVDALLFGGEDFTADIGATRTAEQTEMLHARQRVVLAASAAGVDAIDTLNTDFHDEEGLRADAEFALELGFDGKICIHPGQVEVVNEAFTPAPDRIEWAETVVAARAEAEREGRGVFEVDGEMIDAPLITRATQVLERARAAGVDVAANVSEIENDKG
ncbi:MAG: CoA ester lyase [Haloarculaceae archaeon]